MFESGRKARYDAGYVERARLRDGTPVALRALGPGDRDLLRRGFASLSPESRYLRFFGAKTELSAAELTELTRPADADRLAIGAARLDDSGREVEGLGVARFIRDPDDPAAAEAGITVIDAAQGRGLGTLLLERLAAAARERGIRRFRAELLASNRRVRRLVESHGGTVAVEPGSGVLRVEVELPRGRPPPGPDRGRKSVLQRLLALVARDRISKREERVMDRIWIEHYEDGVPARLDYEAKTVVDYLDDAARTRGDRPALTLKGKTLTYAELREQVDRFATGLAGLGVGRNTRVALWMPNLPQMAIAYFATLRLGAQVVNTNPLYVEREIEEQFNDAGVSVVVTLDFLWLNKLRPILGRTGVKHVVVGSIPDYLPFPLNLLAPLKLKKTGQYAKVPREPNVHSFKEMVAGNDAAPPAVEYGLDDVAVLQYTGGTTGTSKGAMLTHRNLSTNAQQCRSWFPIIVPGEEVLLACLPYFHVFGMTVSMLWPVVIGAHIVLAPNPRDIKDLVKSITRHRVSLFPALPALFVAINEYPGIDRLDISSIKGCFSGSAPLPVEVLERFESLTGGKITEGFGLTETSPVTHANPLNGVRKVGSVGVPLPDTDMKIVDVDTGETELDIGDEGELCIRGPQVMAGYWNRPEETAATLRDGWVHTGDLARIDEDGYTYIVGRKKDMIVAAGYNVYPDEIDGVLYAHPAVLEAATIGVPDPRRGETVKSFIVLKPGARTTEDEIVAFCREQLAPYKVPRMVEFVPELPKSSMMKILRRELRDRQVAREEAEAASEPA